MINKLLLLILLTTTAVMGAVLLSEDYRSPSGQNTWTTTLTGGTYDFGATMPYNISTGGLLTITDGTVDCYMTIDPATAHDTNCYQEYLYVDSTNIANGEVINLFRSGVDASSATWRLVISKAAAGYQFYVIYRVTNNSNVETGRKVINWDTRYGVRVKYDRTNRNVQFIVDGVTITDTTVEAMDRTMGHFIVGSPANLNTGDKYIKLYRDHLSINDNAFADPVNLPTKTPNCSLLVRTSGGSGNEAVSPTGMVAAVNCADSIRIRVIPAITDSFLSWQLSSDSLTMVWHSMLYDTADFKNNSDTLNDTLTALYCTKGWTCNSAETVASNTGTPNIHSTMGFCKIVKCGDTVFTVWARGSYQELYRRVNGSWSAVASRIGNSSAIMIDSAKYIYWFNIEQDPAFNLQYVRFRSNTNGSFSWTTIDYVGATETDYYRSITATIDSNNVIYVATNGGDPDSIMIYRTENSGSDWIKCTSPTHIIAGSDSGWFNSSMDVTRKNILLLTCCRWGSSSLVGSPPPVIITAYSLDKGVTWDTTWHNTGDSLVRFPNIIAIGDSSFVLAAQKQVSSRPGAVSTFSSNLGKTIGAWNNLFVSQMVNDGYGDPALCKASGGTIYAITRSTPDVAANYRMVIYKSTDTNKHWVEVDRYYSDTTCTPKNAMRQQTWYSGGGPLMWLFGIHAKANAGDTLKFDQNTLVTLENNRPHTPSITITEQPISDTLTAGVPTISAAWTGDSVQHAWWWYHAGDSTYITDSVFSKSVTSANNGDSVKLVLWNISDTISGNTAFIRVVYAVFDSVNTTDSTKIYVHGNFLNGSGWTATLSDSTLTTESGNATSQVFGYNHKILLKKKRYKLNIINGAYSMLLNIGSGNQGKIFFFFGGK